MTRNLVLCNHESVDLIPAEDSYDNILHVNATPPNENINLEIDNITHRIFSEPHPLAHDLLEIAAYVYYADGSIRRGTEKDVFADAWKRQIDFIIPISDPELWNDPIINKLLKETLDFVSGDDLSFTFTNPKPREGQLHMNFPNPRPFPEADCVCLFSGGLDSLIGSVYALKERGSYPLLVSHRSMPKIDRRQRTLVELLSKRYTEWEFPHLSMWVNRKGFRAVEATQRTRSFLYLSLAAAVAYQLEIDKIYICENGIISVNIPQSGQNIGSLLSRSTHPKFLKLFERLVRLVFESNLHVENPFFNFTKPEMLKELNKWNGSELIQATVSCIRTEGMTKMQPHCGTCSQCVDRRFCVIATGLEEHDPVEFYEKDLFLHSLKEGQETAFVEGYVRTAFEIWELNDLQFFAKYPELEDLVGYLPGSPDEVGSKIYEMFQRYSTEVIRVAIEQCNLYQRDLLAGELPDNCLISMLAHRRHLDDPLSVYTEKLARILRRALRIDFRSQKPEKEHRLQDATEAALAAADEKLKRESPMLSYSIVQTKPDFSNIPDFNRLFFKERI